MTMRRLLVLIRALPPDALLWAQVKQSEERAQHESKIARLRERQAYWDERQREVTA